MHYRKFFIAFLTASTIAVSLISLSACQTLGDSNSDDDKNGILSYVPGESIFFVGGMESAPANEFFKMFGDSVGVYEQAVIDVVQKSDKPLEIPGEKIFTRILLDYYDAYKNPEEFIQKTGIDNNLRFAIYSVGTIPVIRVRLSNPEIFATYVQNIETQAEIQSVMETRGNLTIRKYSMNKPSSSNPLKTSLAIGIQGNYAVFTAIFNNQDEKLATLNRQILGEVKPAVSLNESRLSALVEKYHFDSRMLFFLDHKQILRGLTHSDNQFGEMLNTFKNFTDKNKLLEQAAENLDEDMSSNDNKSGAENAEPNLEKPKNSLAKFQTPACQKELATKVETWPQTVAGYTKLEYNSKPAKIESKIIVEINDEKFNQSLAKIRGVVPEFLSNTDQAMMFGLGIGINIDELAPFVSQFVQEFSAPDYQCQVLANMKKKLQASNPGMALAMVTGMAAGVEGVSASLLNFEGKFDPAMKNIPQFIDLQAIVTLSAKNPQMLLMMLSKLKPEIPQIQLPADGSPVDLPLPLPIPDHIKLAQKGNHIVAYIGKDAVLLADKLKNTPLQGNSIYSVNVDFDRLIKMALTLPNANPDSPKSDPKFQEALAFFQKFKYHFVENFDFTANGIEFTTLMVPH